MKPTLAAANQFTPMLKKRRPSAETPQVLLKLEDLQTPVSKKNITPVSRYSSNAPDGNNGPDIRSFSVNRSDIDPQDVYADIKALLFTALEKLSLLEKQGSFTHSSYSDASTQTNELRRSVSVKRCERSRSAKQQQLQQQKIAQKQSDENSSNNSASNNAVRNDAMLKKSNSTPENNNGPRRIIVKSTSESDCKLLDRLEVRERLRRKMSLNQLQDDNVNNENSDSSQRRRIVRYYNNENNIVGSNKTEKIDCQKGFRNEDTQNNEAMLHEDGKHFSYYSDSSYSEVRISLRKTKNSPLAAQRVENNCVIDRSSSELNI